MLAAIAAAVQLAWPRPAPADEQDPVHRDLALQRALVEQAGAAAPRPALGAPLTVYVDDWRQRATVRGRADRWSHLLADDPDGAATPWPPRSGSRPGATSGTGARRR